MSTYIIDDNKLYLEDDKGLYVDYVLCEADEGEAVPRWNGPKIPFDTFREMTAWCEETQRRLESETMVLLFLDENNQWKHWYCPQETSGMSVKSDDESELYIEERKNYPDRQLGTLHHHCNTGAFQSPTDSNDEDDRDGLHFTIGDLGTKKYSLHARFCVNGESHECNTADVVEPPEWMENIPKNIRPGIMEKLLTAPTETFKEDHFKELIEKVVTEETFTPHIRSSIGGPYYRNAHSSQDVHPDIHPDVHEALIHDCIITNLHNTRDKWEPKGRAFCKSFFGIDSDNEPIELYDIIQALESGGPPCLDSSKEARDFVAEIRIQLCPFKWPSINEIIEYLEEIYEEDLYK